MKIVYEVINRWVQYGKPGGTQLDFDVFRGTEVIGRFETREAAEKEIESLRLKAQERMLAINIEEEFDNFEINQVKVPEDS